MSLEALFFVYTIAGFAVGAIGVAVVHLSSHVRLREHHSNHFEIVAINYRDAKSHLHPIDVIDKAIRDLDPDRDSGYVSLTWELPDKTMFVIAGRKKR